MDTALAEFATTRSAEAFRRLVAAHVDAVYAQCLRRLDDPAAAEDATQAVFVTLAQKAPKLSADTVLGGWLYVTAQNVCLNARRSASRRATHERKAAAMRHEVQDATKAADAGAMWRDVRAVLDDAIARLGSGLRDAVVLRFLEGRSMLEVAAALGISEDAAKQRVSRAVKALREQLAGRGVAVPAVLLPGLLEMHAGPIAAPAVLVESTVAGALAAPVAPAAGAATLAKVAAAAAVLVGGAAAVVSSVALVGSTTRAAQAAAPVGQRVPAGAATQPIFEARVVVGQSLAATTLPVGADAPAELVGIWRLTTKDELIPRDDGKRLRLLPIVVEGQDIRIETRGLEADGPPNRRIELRVIAAKLDAEWRGLDAVVTEMTRDGNPQVENVGNIIPIAYRIDAGGLLHLRMEGPELVLGRDEPAPTTLPTQP